MGLGEIITVIYKRNNRKFISIITKSSRRYYQSIDRGTNHINTNTSRPISYLTSTSASNASNNRIKQKPLSSSSSSLPPFSVHRFFSDSNSSSDDDDDADDDDNEGPVTNKLRGLIAEGSIQPDPHQLRAVMELDRVYRDLIASTTTRNNDENNNDSNMKHQQEKQSSLSSSTSFFSQFFGGSTSSNNDTTNDSFTSIKGAYTYGGVGCGKTFLMELLYHELDNDEVWSNDKQIIHYHKFMLNVHQFMHTARQEQREQGIEDINLIDPVVDHILSSGKLLCLDEFQVTDVADAMILKELFTRLWKKGCVLVTTSNRPPKDLYLHGLQRDRFLPFIDVLKEHCVTVSLMDDDIDYRMVISAQDDDDDDDEIESKEETSDNLINASLSPSATTTPNGVRQPPKKKKKKKTRAKQVYFCGKDQKRVIQKLFYERAKGRPSNPTTLSTQGRKVKIPMACKPKSACMFSFEDLCQKALGAADYLVIGQQFSTVFVYGIPQMTVNEINWLRRFITFVDSMYEWKVRLILQTNANTIEEIFKCDDKESYQQDEVFAFDRTRSRLSEMSSKQYLSRQWLGDSSSDGHDGDNDNDDHRIVTARLDLDPSIADQWFQLVGSNIHQKQNVNSSNNNSADENDLTDFKKLFETFDLNKDGVLDKYEIKKMMTTAFGYEPVDLVVNEMIASIDTDENGVINSNEFFALLDEIKKHQQTG